MSRLREKLIEHYAAHYARGNDDIDPTSLRPRVVRMMDRTFGPALERVPRGGRVLDVGCGTGFLLNWLMKRGGVSPVGVDSSPSQIEVLKRHLPGVEVHCGDALVFMKERPGQFDAIFCTDVLEHIPDDVLLEWAEAARGALKANGVFVCRVPNASSLIGGHVRYVDLTHERSFTVPSLFQLLEAAGFVDVRVLPLRTSHMTGRLRLAAEAVLHRVVFALSGNSGQRVFTSTLSASATRSDAAH